MGTVDAAIKAGGTDVNTSVLTANEEWNGTLWSEIADMPTKENGAGSGTVNAGLYAGGTDGGFGGYTEATGSLYLEWFVLDRNSRFTKYR